MADHNSGDYHKGEMDIHMQQSTYELFMNLTKWGSLILTVILTFFILLFAVKGAGFFPAAGVSFAIAVIGFFLLKKPADTGH